MTIDIDKLTEVELVNLNRKIVERLKMIGQMKAHAHMMNFSIGERVGFYNNKNEIIVRVLTKYNKKTVSIITDDGIQWNVSPSLLKKEKEIFHDANTIEI